MVRLRLDIAYDGSGFHGWTRQPGLRTVQGELETALATVFRRFGEPPTLTVAGRTDAGVHATGQVAHLDLDDAQFASLRRPGRGGRSPLPPGEALARRLNGIAGLDADVWVARADVAPDGFDARFGAIWRRYEYRIADTRAPRNPVERVNTLWYPGELDERELNSAAASVVGLHDFAAYCKPREEATTIRTLQDFRWRRLDSGVLLAELQADAFCHSMVRALVGTSLAVGDGRVPAERMREVLDSRDRSGAYPVAAAKGLTLVAVGYPPDSELAARAEQTRNRRQEHEVSSSAVDRPSSEALK
ncbi:tRNA pseudouridine(38-40) synthase TruA [Desertivibrio insolitus]|uniref:tRNA pseudouridine(38-40) synthase TruA n=1 Tax=Herbiconiux sp. SYSU D00978 TaxID=2812562 RepID=UPI001A958681|nr:tRNA pseudouridine(38-40) synthase TruA [Herbiconiux sp. SYSU D00978]